MSLVDDGESEFKMKEFCRRIGVNKHLTMPITLEMMFRVSMMMMKSINSFIRMINLKKEDY
jgi:hypothetical protein